MIQQTLGDILLALHATGHLQGETPNDHDWKVLVSDDNPRLFYRVTWFKTHPDRRSSPVTTQPLIESLLKKGGFFKITGDKKQKENTPHYRSHYIGPTFQTTSAHQRLESLRFWTHKIAHFQGA